MQRHVMQAPGALPVLRHGGNVIADSDAITKYLRKTYPEQLDSFLPEDPTRCAAGQYTDARAARARAAARHVGHCVVLPSYSLLSVSSVPPCALPLRRPGRVHTTSMCRAALALSLLRMLEESTYFALNYCSFVPRDVFLSQLPIIFHDVARPLRGVVAAVFRRKILRDLDGQALLYSISALRAV